MTDCIICDSPIVFMRVTNQGGLWDNKIYICEGSNITLVLYEEGGSGHSWVPYTSYTSWEIVEEGMNGRILAFYSLRNKTRLVFIL